jgi:hypothetical protein
LAKDQPEDEAGVEESDRGRPSVFLLLLLLLPLGEGEGGIEVGEGGGSSAVTDLVLLDGAHKLDWDKRI